MGGKPVIQGTGEFERHADRAPGTPGRDAAREDRSAGRGDRGAQGRERGAQGRERGAARGECRSAAATGRELVQLEQATIARSPGRPAGTLEAGAQWAQAGWPARAQGQPPRIVWTVAQRDATGIFGPRLLTLVAVLVGSLHVSRRKVQTLLADLLGIKSRSGSGCTVTGSRSPAPWSSGSLEAADVDRDRVPAVLLCELRRDSHRGATRGRTSTALRTRRDHDGVDALGHRAGAGRGGAAPGLRLVGHVRGGEPVAGAGALGAGPACRARRPWPDTDRRGRAPITRDDGGPAARCPTCARRSANYRGRLRVLLRPAAPPSGPGSARPAIPRNRAVLPILRRTLEEISK